MVTSKFDSLKSYSRFKTLKKNLPYGECLRRSVSHAPFEASIHPLTKNSTFAHVHELLTKYLYYQAVMQLALYTY